MSWLFPKEKQQDVDVVENIIRASCPFEIFRSAINMLIVTSRNMINWNVGVKYEVDITFLSK